MQFGEVQLVARWIERRESVGPQQSVRGDHEVNQQSLRGASARGRAALRIRRKAPGGGSPYLFFQVEIHRDTRLGQKPHTKCWFTNGWDRSSA
jgi:hypothetical protein